MGRVVIFAVTVADVEEFWSWVGSHYVAIGIGQNAVIIVHRVRGADSEMTAASDKWPQLIQRGLSTQGTNA